ncbi:dihydrofolate reductase [Teredinibacter sp. KSP-S5-2]|uniref:dihydrofolate reductase n=1 Tax=Teredinibacter sp. KSP-S5-2 TaxID=3034506 RepID=UPI0029352E0B|nr:dihydrofolate reductase [Teredinibacter sp. KSP-S5-2]WNO08864.1 dihydrofolate reductase [Teredinibacter sp. KSP-S5-2]
MSELALVVAVAENGVIGRDNQLPWRLSRDLQYFKRVTMGAPMIMGRKTFESIGKPLPGRLSIVVTRQQDWAFEGVKVAHSLENAIAIAEQAIAAGEYETDQVFVVGGAQLYGHAIQMSAKLYLTEVHAEVEGDTFFPRFDRNEWREVSREKPEKVDGDSHPYSFVILERISATS